MGCANGHIFMLQNLLNDCGLNKKVKWLVQNKYVELVRTFHSFIQIYMGVTHRVSHTDGVNEDQILKQMDERMDEEGEEYQ